MAAMLLRRIKEPIKPITVISKEIIKPIEIVHYDDKDGVEFKNDKCPNTPNGYAVDEKGCISQYKFTNLRYNTAIYKLKIKSKIELNKLYVFLNKHSNLNVKIVGHTDNQGNLKNNKILSNKRSKEVKKFLQLRGVSKDRISIKYLGETQPIKSNDTQNGRAFNRRVELFISNN